jgi:hypothetical protein
MAPDLDATELAALIELLREEVKNTRWPLAPPTKMLRRILAKLNRRHRQPSRIRR